MKAHLFSVIRGDSLGFSVAGKFLLVLSILDGVQLVNVASSEDVLGVKSMLDATEGVDTERLNGALDEVLAMLANTVVMRDGASAVQNLFASRVLNVSELVDRVFEALVGEAEVEIDARAAVISLRDAARHEQLGLDACLARGAMNAFLDTKA